MTTRKYSSKAQQTTLSAPITSTAGTMTVVNGAAVMGGKTLTGTQTYTVVIDPDTALEEIVNVTLYSSGNTLTIARGIDSASPGTGSAHSAGAVVRHMAIGRDYQEANDHIEASTGVHGISGSVVGTTDSQTLTNKIIAAGSNTITGITSAMITDGTIVAGDIANGTITAAKLVADPFARANHTGTQTANTVSDFDTQVRTSRLDQMAAPTGSLSLNSQKITNLATPTSNTDASTKAYVDTSISNLIAGAPSTLDTLDEIAAALADTANFSDTVVLKSGSTMTGNLAMGTNKITGLGTPTASTDAATKGYIDTVTLAPSNLTGPITSVGNVTSVASQTGTGSTFVMNTSPTLVTPVLGIATATSINGTIIPTSKTLVATDSTQYVVPSQTSNAGKYLTTDGSTASWATVTTDPTADIFMMMGA
jgi:hypothetical protein